MKKINAGIIGGSGFVGGELCRLLLNHKNISQIFPSSRSKKSFKRTHPNLSFSKLNFCSVDSIINNKKINVVFLCTKSNESMKYAEIFIKKNIFVIDLSGAFRFKTIKKYKLAYGTNHSKKKLLRFSAYGATEFNKNKIKQSKLIANPGCYALCSLIGLAPLIKEKIVDFKKIIKIHAINGSTGAGNTLKKEIMHTNLSDNMLAYNADGHRHAPEIEEKLESLFNLKNVKIDLNTAHGNFKRGIFMQTSLELKNKIKKNINRDILIKIYKKYYNDKNFNNDFIFINDLDKVGKKNDKDYLIYPQLSSVIGTNNCLIGLDFESDKKIIKIISVLDNLMKGAAGSAIQNMNLIFNFNIRESLNFLSSS